MAFQIWMTGGVQETLRRLGVNMVMGRDDRVVKMMGLAKAKIIGSLKQLCNRLKCIF